MFAAGRQPLTCTATVVIATLLWWRHEEAYDLFWIRVLNVAESVDIDEPTVCYDGEEGQQGRM